MLSFYFMFKSRWWLSQNWPCPSGQRSLNSTRNSILGSRAYLVCALTKLHSECQWSIHTYLTARAPWNALLAVCLTTIHVTMTRKVIGSTYAYVQRSGKGSLHCFVHISTMLTWFRHVTRWNGERELDLLGVRFRLLGDLWLWMLWPKTLPPYTCQ